MEPDQNVNNVYVGLILATKFFTWSMLSMWVTWIPVKENIFWKGIKIIQGSQTLAQVEVDLFRSVLEPMGIEFAYITVKRKPTNVEIYA